MQSLSRQKIGSFGIFILTLSCVGSVWAQEAPVAISGQPATPVTRGNIISPEMPKLEDWSTPSLAGSHLGGAEPLVGEVDDNDPDFTRELTRVQWRAGDPIDLLYREAGWGEETAGDSLPLLQLPFGHRSLSESGLVQNGHQKRIRRSWLCLRVDRSSVSQPSHEAVVREPIAGIAVHVGA